MESATSSTLEEVDAEVSRISTLAKGTTVEAEVSAQLLTAAGVWALCYEMVRLNEALDESNNRYK